jgi:antirestriction protein ArdC
VQTPLEEQFSDFSSFAETVGHELLHWSEHRVGWEENHAFSELRAEIGACFFSEATGVPVSSDLTNHAKYLESWLQALSQDDRYLFRAASGASRGVDFLLSFSRPQEESDVESEAEAVPPMALVA